MPRRLPDLLSKYPKIEPLTSRYLSAIPAVVSSVGGCGSGKTYALVSLISLMKKEGTITHLFLISPTAKSNTVYKAIIDPDKDHVYDDLGPAVFKTLHDVQDIMQGVANDYKKQLEYAIAFDKFITGETVSAVEEQLLEDGGYRKIAVKRPSFGLFIDDAQNSALFSRNSKNPLGNMVLRHRHCADGLGLNVFFAAQTMKNGIPRSLRTNSTHFLMFRTCSATEIESLYQEVAGFVSKQEFERLLSLYTHERHGYLFADMPRGIITNSF